jgi:hypothetical protein
MEVRNAPQRITGFRRARDYGLLHAKRRRLA